MSISKPPVRRRVGLRRIAEELDVSVSLVSKVLSGHLGTSGATASVSRAIHQKAAELNYRKNVLAEALRTGRQNVLAVFVHRVGEQGSGITEEMIAGIAEEAAGHRQRLLLQYFGTAAEFRQTALEVHRNAVDGVIVGGCEHAELIDDFQALHREGLPVVTIHDRQVSPQFCNVVMDQVEVGRQATNHLIDQGCQRIVHLSALVSIAPPRSSRPGMHHVPLDRLEGYRRALSERGLPLRPELMLFAGDFGYQSAARVMQQLLDSRLPFDGVVGDSDPHAVAALNLLVQRGLAVPDQVKLIGIDDSPFCPFTIVPLSSISQEHTARGRHAVRLLMDQLRGAPPSSLRVEPRVRARQSSSFPTLCSEPGLVPGEVSVCST